METRKKLLEFPVIPQQIQPVSAIPKTRSEKETERQLQALQETADRLFSDPEKARKFFVSRGYITRGGKLTARYRSK
jgi:hypothetical protein